MSDFGTQEHYSYKCGVCGQMYTVANICCDSTEESEGWD